MNIAISTKHSTDPFGEPVIDAMMVEGEVYQYGCDPEYVTVRSGATILYWSLPGHGCITYPFNSCGNSNNPLPAKVVVTLTQD